MVFAYGINSLPRVRLVVIGQRVSNEYYLLLEGMLLLMIIDERQNHTAITMTGSMKHSILYAPAQQNFNGANVNDTIKISGYSNQ